VIVGQPVIGQALNQLNSGFCGEGRHSVGEILEAARGHIGDLAPAVADVHDDGAAGGIEDALAARSDQINAIGPLHRERGSSLSRDE